MNILDIETWETPATKYTEERFGNFRIRREDFPLGMRGLEGIDDHVYYDVKHPIPITRLEELKEGKWDNREADDPCTFMAMQKYAQASFGKVLVVGMGLGLVVHELAKNKDVESITIVEKSGEICQLVYNYLPACRLVISDFWNFIKTDNEKWDTILLNLWVVHDAWEQQSLFLKEVLPANFTLRGKYPNAKISFYGFRGASDIRVGKIIRGEGKWKPYGFQLLRGTMRDYVIKKIKAPLMKAIMTLASKYPAPTRENTIHPNTHKLLAIEDKFLGYEDNPQRKPLFEAAFKLLIAEYEHDPYYRWRFDWFLEEINKSHWVPRKIGRVRACWKEPRE